MTQDIIDEIFRNNLVPHTQLLRGYIIIIDGKVFYDGLGKFLYRTRNAAVKGFYNQMKWKAQYYTYYHTPEALRSTGRGVYYREPLLSVEDYNLLRDFRKFKRYLITNHHFEIIRLG